MTAQVTFTRVLVAYIATELKPMRQRCFTGSGEACGLAACYRLLHPYASMSEFHKLRFHEEFGYDFVEGFILGFDRFDQYPEFKRRTAENLLSLPDDEATLAICGYEIGARLGKLLFEALLTPQQIYDRYCKPKENPQ